MDQTPASSFTTSRPVAVLMVFLAAMVFGGLSYRRLPVTLMPELSYPTLTVRTEYAGSAPEEVENDISRPIEEELGRIKLRFGDVLLVLNDEGHHCWRPAPGTTPRAPGLPALATICARWP